MTWFGVGETADRGEMLGIFSLISLAITASTAGAVALLGPAGALVGALYFTLGTVISGASILPEFLPAFGRRLGENLPTGAGVQAVRDDLYFPAAAIGGHLIVLGLYAGIGALVVLVTNMLPNRRNSTSEVELELVERLEGSERREPVSDPGDLLFPRRVPACRSNRGMSGYAPASPSRCASPTATPPPPR